SIRAFSSEIPVRCGPRGSGQSPSATCRGPSAEVNAPRVRASGTTVHSRLNMSVLVVTPFYRTVFRCPRLPPRGCFHLKVEATDRAQESCRFRLPPSREASADRRSLGGGGQAEDPSTDRLWDGRTGRFARISVA